ncbi:PucR family transcriptional regulator [Occultella aeris]|uniref:Purine catabolism regulatory protein-like family protein n=1 Tax=Occultella aeris TaxID=2761496 RepID=A0A7M4DSJ2_9MICO|nr:PucR family transcriptional regulator [Occultella aeris]VZO40436.1 Purine catabolism regulatory protein-like family protein [Occultella aeris]
MTEEVLFEPGLALRDLLTWPGFDVKLLGGADGLDRDVRWAQATDLLDPGPYLRGEEFVLTTGAVLLDDAACRTFVDNLVAANAVGLGYGVGVVTDEVPTALVAAASAAGLPIVSVPPTTPFLTFTERLAEVRAQARSQAEQRTALGTLLDYVRRGLADPTIVLEYLPELSRVGTRVGAIAIDPATHLEDRLIGGRIVASLLGRTVLVATAEVVATFARTAGPDEVYGIGGPGAVRQLPRILSECLSAHIVALRRGSPAGPKDLATLDALVQRLSADQVGPFHDHIYRPLLESDRLHGTDLLHTLDVFLAQDGALAASAKQLFLHPNSLRNRLARITEITGTNPLTVSGRLAITIALSTRPDPLRADSPNH